MDAGKGSRGHRRMVRMTMSFTARGKGDSVFEVIQQQRRTAEFICHHVAVGHGQETHFRESRAH